jgi:hypothetical protein
MDNNCGIKRVDLKSAPSDLLLVLDRSLSMRRPEQHGLGQL